MSDSRTVQGKIKNYSRIRMAVKIFLLLHHNGPCSKGKATAQRKRLNS